MGKKRGGAAGAAAKPSQKAQGNVGKRQRGGSGGGSDDGQAEAAVSDEEWEEQEGEEEGRDPDSMKDDGDEPSAVAETADISKPETSASAVTLVGAWAYNENTIALTGADNELVVLLAPFETLYLHGSASVSVIAGTASCFGAVLTPMGWGSKVADADAAAGRGQRSVHLHAVAPYGPLGVQAAGAAARQLDAKAMAWCSGTAAKSEQERERLSALLTTALAEGKVAAVVLLQRLEHSADPRGGPGAGERSSDAGRGKPGRARWWREGGDGGSEKVTDMVWEAVGCRLLLARARMALTVQPHAAPADWRALGDMVVQLAGAGRPGGGGLRLAVVGAKGSGKSTLARFLLNRLLSRWPAVYFLDADVGQPEFSPAGIVSISRVEAPLLGPPATHLSREWEAAAFSGEVSPEEDPERYRACLQSVAAAADSIEARDARLLGAPGGVTPPMLINTSGWVKGLGLELLGEIVAGCRAMHLVVCQVGNARKDLPLPRAKTPAGPSKRALKRRGVAPDPTQPVAERGGGRGGGGAPGGEAEMPEGLYLPGVSVHAVAPLEQKGAGSVNPAELRGRQLVAYLTQSPTPGPEAAARLASAPPYKVRLADVGVHFTQGQIPAAEVLGALNATVVGLCRSNGQADDPCNDCVGLGLVRSIDEESNSLYILTPIAPALLQGVDVLVRGSLALPLTALTPAGASYNGADTRPYLALNSLGAAGTGSAAMKSRSNIARRGHQG